LSLKREVTHILLATAFCPVIYNNLHLLLMQSVEQVVGSVHGELRRDGDSKEFLRDVQRLLITGSNLLLHWTSRQGTM